MLHHKIPGIPNKIQRSVTSLVCVCVGVILRKEIVVSPLLRRKTVRTSMKVFPKTGSKHEETRQQRLIPINQIPPELPRTFRFLIEEKPPKYSCLTPIPISYMWKKSQVMRHVMKYHVLKVVDDQEGRWKRNVREWRKCEVCCDSLFPVPSLFSQFS